MKCEGCGGNLNFTGIPLEFLNKRITIKCPLCKFVTPFYYRKGELETEKEREERMVRWMKRKDLPETESKKPCPANHEHLKKFFAYVNCTWCGEPL